KYRLLPSYAPITTDRTRRARAGSVASASTIEWMCLFGLTWPTVRSNCRSSVVVGACALGADQSVGYVGRNRDASGPAQRTRTASACDSEWTTTPSALAI